MKRRAACLGTEFPSGRAAPECRFYARNLLGYTTPEVEVRENQGDPFVGRMRHRRGLIAALLCQQPRPLADQLFSPRLQSEEFGVDLAEAGHYWIDEVIDCGEPLWLRMPKTNPQSIAVLLIWQLGRVDRQKKFGIIEHPIFRSLAG